MTDRLFAAGRESILTGLDGDTAVVVLLDTEPTRTDPDGPYDATTVADLIGELDRDTSTFDVSVGDPPALSLMTSPTLDPGVDSTVGYAVCTDGATDADRVPLVWVPVTSTSDPVVVSTGALAKISSAVELGDLVDGEATTGQVPTRQSDGSTEWATPSGGSLAGLADVDVSGAPTPAVLGSADGGVNWIAAPLPDAGDLAADPADLPYLDSLEGDIANQRDVNIAVDGQLSLVVTQAIPSLLANSMGVVAHGSDPDVARPDGYSVVTWIGTVEPNNWVAGDLWEDPS